MDFAVLNSTPDPAAALQFARYVSRDRGLREFGCGGFQVDEGDVWDDVPH